jgi:hypothetical protein
MVYRAMTTMTYFDPDSSISDEKLVDELVNNLKYTEKLMNELSARGITVSFNLGQAGKGGAFMLTQLTVQRIEKLFDITEENNQGRQVTFD